MPLSPTSNRMNNLPHTRRPRCSERGYSLGSQVWEFPTRTPGQMTAQWDRNPGHSRALLVAGRRCPRRKSLAHLAEPAPLNLRHLHERSQLVCLIDDPLSLIAQMESKSANTITYRHRNSGAGLIHERPFGADQRLSGRDIFNTSFFALRIKCCVDQLNSQPRGVIWNQNTKRYLAPKSDSYACVKPLV